MDGLAIALLGEPRLAYAGAPLDCASKKALGVFAYVALAGGRRPRRELARLFWGSANDEAARTSLRTALQRLPRPLAQALAVERDSIALLDAGNVELDTARFAAAAAADDIESLQHAADLYRGELLKDLEFDAAPEFDDWLQRERGRLRQVAQSVFQRLIARHRERAQRDSAHAGAAREAALAAARRWVALEPAAEAAHRWLMQLLFESGQRDAAHAQYEVCRRELAVAAGRTPDVQTRALAEAIGGADAAPAPPQRVQLPMPGMAGTSFVGRIDELAALERLVAEPACRLLTLHGLGGVGKSRLAAAFAQAIGGRFAQGANWVALDAVQAAAQLPSAIAGALGIELPPQAEPAAALAAALRAQERLVVLDNFEQLLPEGADLVLALLREAPRLSLLVTSREVLGLQEEWVYELTGLAYPAAAEPQAGDYPAVELFVQRARQAYLGFSAQAEWPNIARICRLTEGLPLALELAAAWVRTLPCADLGRAIETEMAALASRHRNRPPRQRSLDAVVRTSWSLLAREQQHALAGLAVFVGGFTHEAAQAVADAPLRVLSALADKSLVTRRGDCRLGLHELVRQFAAAQLSARGQAARLVRRRHSSFYAALLARCRARLDGPDEAEADDALNADLANVLAAAAHWHDDGIALDEVAEPLGRVLLARGRMREVRAQIDAWLGLPVAPATRALLLAQRGRAHAMLRHAAASRADFDAAIALAREHGLRHALAYASVHAVVVPAVDDRYDEALARLDELDPMLGEIDDALLQVRARQLRGQMHHGRGELMRAAEWLSAAVAAARRLGSPSALAVALRSLAMPLTLLGRFDEAEAALREAMPPLERAGSPHLGQVLNTLAQLILWRGGEAAEAAALARRALELFERIGFDTGTSSAADTLGQALQALGRGDEARMQFERASTIGGPITTAEALFHLALLELHEGRMQRARVLALEQLQIAESDRLTWARHKALLLGAAVAAREPASHALGRRWLLDLLADAELSVDVRRLAESLLGGLPPGDAAPPSESLDALRRFLSRGA